MTQSQNTQNPFQTRTGATSLMQDPNYWLRDMEYLYLRSFNELETVFRQDFRNSKAFEEMVLELNQNMIEYKFLHKAGILKAT